MKKYTIFGEKGESNILIGERISNLERYIDADHLFLVTDSNVRHLYEKNFPAGKVIEIGTGEKIKTIETVQAIYKKLLEHEADRSSFIIGIGGGIVCDITGFAASTYLRGVRFGFVSTTLLSQVDASVGGKNGVNFQGYKNMVGVFNQPEFVICDNAMLATLPEKELLCGFAEIIKHAAIADFKYFEYLEKNQSKALNLDSATIEKVVYDSVQIKADVVNKDEREKGERKKLNFGHTFGHAVEKISGIPHGEAVSIGIAFAADLSVKKGLLQQNEADRIILLLKKYGLPSEIDVEAKLLADAMEKDKKRSRDTIHFVLLESIGKAVIQTIAIDDLKNAIFDWQARRLG
ncbi:3-dehydroquinate synthase [Desulfobacterales bacterium HSG16]|nr:3-dehydroquinate synthase [Desulfobacterales bacterium HSG16]